MKNLNVLAKIITEKESGKKSLSIAQVKEVLKIIAILTVEEPDITFLLYENGLRHLGRLKE